jgi:acyl dehydratase
LTRRFAWTILAGMESRFAAHVGKEAPPRVYDVERGHIRRFVEAVGDPDPMYLDEEAARQAGHPRIPAPPTFATALRANDPREGVDIDFKKLLHGEQEFVYERPVYAGDRLTVTGRIAEAYAKEGKAGVMDFLVTETRATDENGQLVFTARSTAVIKR